MTALSDARWASSGSEKNSTSREILIHGRRYINSWSKIQSPVGLSSVESDLYGAVTVTSEARFVLRDMGG